MQMHHVHQSLKQEYDLDIENQEKVNLLVEAIHPKDFDKIIYRASLIGYALLLYSTLNN